MKNLFHDDWQPPMPGGWHFHVDGEMIRGSSGEEVFEKVKRLLGNNKRHPGDAELERQLWDYWCSLNPARCGLSTQEMVPAVSREIPKTEWGRSLWLHINHTAVHFDREYFLALCTALTRKLIPCHECRAHFSVIMNELPPWNITTQMQACEWAFETHNRVNERLGKRLFTWPQAMAQFGFPTKQ
jgi:hypothetical protein